MSPLGSILLWIFQWLYTKALTLIHSGTPKTVPTIKSSILMESATSLANRIRNRKVTSVEVVQSYIRRIQEINDVLNCVVDERFEEALKEAEKADELISSGEKTVEELEKEVPFLGLPFTAAESVGVKGLSHTIGSFDRKNIKADTDGNVVALMKTRGAIPIACSNVSELCLSYETNNPVFGRTKNPYDTNRSSGGPFGGEATLIAASGSPIGIAPTIALSCAFNGIFGHQPSGDLPGVMSRSSADLLPAITLLTSSDINLEDVEMKKLKFYFPEGESEEIRKAMNHFRNQKATVTRIKMAKAQNISKTYFLHKLKINVRMELLKALFGKSQHTFSFLLTILLERNKSTPRQDCSLLQKEFQDLLGSDGVFINPTQPAFRHDESPIRGSAAIFEVLGFPMTQCPAGLDSKGLPVGFQVVGGMNQDRVTIAVAKEIEKVFGGWKPPPTHGVFTLKNTVFRNESNAKVKTL